MRIILNINKEELDMKLIGNALLASATALLFASAANAQEYPVGEPVLKDGMEIVGVYSVSYTHLTLPTILRSCRSRWSPYH